MRRRHRGEKRVGEGGVSVGRREGERSGAISGEGVGVGSTGEEELEGRGAAVGGGEVHRPKSSLRDEHDDR